MASEQTRSSDGETPTVTPSMRRALFWFLMAVLLGLAAVVVVRAQGSSGFYWADDYAHLLISKHAWRQPSALLDIWGRPIMTVLYMPAAVLGETAVRVTSLVLVMGTMALCIGIVRARRPHMPAAVGILLLAQPLTAIIGFSALPQIPFSAVLAFALWLRARRSTTASLLVASLLPLARLEGLVVLLIWAAFLLSDRKWPQIPLLGAGMVAWAVAAWAIHGDPLWLLHENPYGIFGSEYGAAGWRYLFLAFGTVVGPVVGALVLHGFGSRDVDGLIQGLAAGLPLFYGLAWMLGAFQTIATPVYLVSASVPFAIIAHATLTDLIEGEHRRIHFAFLALLVAALSGSARLVVLTAVIAIALLAGRLISTRARVVIAGAVLLLALALAATSIHSLPLSGAPRLARDLAVELDDRARRVHVSTDPAFTWFAGLEGLYGRSRVGGDLKTYIRRVPRGGWVVWDNRLGGSRVSAKAMRSMEYRVVFERKRDDATLILWERG